MSAFGAGTVLRLGVGAAARAWWLVVPLFVAEALAELAALTPTLVLDTNMAISSFGQDEAGELYVTDLNGAFYKIVQG